MASSEPDPGCETIQALFQAAELGPKVPREEYDQQITGLRTRLLQLQQALRDARIPVLILVNGVEGAGKAEVVNELGEWLDPRGIDVCAYWKETDEEQARPRFWRFWRDLPSRGRIGLFFGSWYSTPIVERVLHENSKEAFAAELQRVAETERMLARDGLRIIKFWFHVSKAAQKKHFHKLEQDPLNRWRVTKQDWEYHHLYERFTRVSEQALSATHQDEAPWHIIDSENPRHRNLATARLLQEQFEAALSAATRRKKAVPAPAPRRIPDALGRVSLTARLKPEIYEQKLAEHTAELNRLTWEAARKNIPILLVFEGWDAAGKGGVIRRLATAIDAKLRRVVSIAAPTEAEKAQHYLWRFWRNVPAAGRVVIFDRSWYGRVLVERVEGFARPEEWQRAYGEINSFEEQFTQRGGVLMKFWLHISPEEQLRRFKEREQTAYKQHKITPEDWRNRHQWANYTQAVNEMVARTHTPEAPWLIVPGNDKLFARVAILRALRQQLNQRV